MTQWPVLLALVLVVLDLYIIAGIAREQEQRPTNAVEILPQKLLTAIEKDDKPAVRKIVDADPGVLSLSDSDGWTPLAYAARFGRLELVKYFITKGATVDALDKQRYTPLHQAASYGNKEVAEELLKHGAAINARTVGEVTPRRLAFSNGHRAVANFLKGKGGFL